MKVYKNGQFDKKSGCVLALGSFEALHCAHIKLLDIAVCEAKKRGISAGVHMFCERIENVIYKENIYKSVYTNEQRTEIVAQTGIDFVYFEKFDMQFMNMSTFDFAKMLKEKFHAECVVIGFHYTFGKGGEGDADLLIKYGNLFGFDVVVMPALELDGEVVSSTKVRDLIKNGDMAHLEVLLGRCYSVCGKVMHDRGVGHKMGLPTANLDIDEDVLLPKNGVYAAYTKIGDKKYSCVVNIGVRPTFELSKICLEVHIIDFDGDLYGENMCIYFIEFLRDEKKFSTQDKLVAQILEDINKTKLLFLHKI